MSGEYSFNMVLHEGKFEIGIDTAARYGYFEHQELGDECGGGLWFERASAVVNGVCTCCGRQFSDENWNCVNDGKCPSDDCPSNNEAPTKLELIDQDGTACLPKSVAKALRAAGFVVREDWD